MSDNENEEGNEKPFSIERAKQGRATCKKCKQKCLSGELRIAKLAHNPFGEGKMKQWHHVNCIFELFLNQRLTTKRIEDSDDIDGWDNLSGDDQKEIRKCIDESEKKIAAKFGDKYSPKKPAPKKPKVQQKQQSAVTADTSGNPGLGVSSGVDKGHKNNLFREFRRLVAEVTNESSYLEKSAIMKNMFTKGSDGNGFKGDIVQWCRLLLPGVIKRIYNLQSKQLIKLFSVIFETNREEMLEHLEQGDVGETIHHFFENSDAVKPCKKSLLTMDDVDNFLEELSSRTKEEEQVDHFKKIIKKCTGNDLKIIIRLIKHDLRMNAGAKHVLDGVHEDAYSAFQASRDLPSVLRRILGNKNNVSESSPVKATIEVMTPVLPMLAQACKSVEQAMKKCPNGMYSEIKYDGERVQVHKHGSDFKYFSRSLKPVMPHKVNHFRNYIPEAFPHASDLILDSEVLMIDTTSGKPLPFGSLGVHKKEEFKNANVCLFVFDCIYYNGQSLTHKPIKERRRILRDNMKEIPNHIMFSEMEEVHKAKDLAAMIAKVLKLGLEGLVLKDIMSVYEPGKRHWLKVKKDYLCDGAMADTVDLIVLGAWFGTGKKGGMMSVFLMGCYDPYSQKFCTVTKVHTGHDDKTLEQLQTELDMIKISAEASKVPNWLECTKTMVPDFVARDPEKQPVWEITGAEFTQHEVHTADGISIRFPRVTRIHSDKNWETATNLQELHDLFKTSKENTDFSMLIKTEADDDESGPSQPDDSPKKTKRKNGSPKVSNENELPFRKVKRESSSPGNVKIKREPSDEDTEVKREVSPSRKAKRENGSRRDVKIKTEPFDEDTKVELEGSSYRKVKREDSSSRDVKIKREPSESSDEDARAKSSSSSKKVNTEEDSFKGTKVKRQTSVSSDEDTTNKLEGSSKKAKSKRDNGSHKDLEVEASPGRSNKAEPSNRKRKSENSAGNDSPKKTKVSHQLQETKALKAFLKEVDIPLIFQNFKLLPLDNVALHNELIIRHFIGMGGEVLTEDEWENATHVAHVQNVNTVPENCPRSAKHVMVDWVKDCIGHCKILDWRPYAVQWIPT